MFEEGARLLERAAAGVPARTRAEVLARRRRICGRTPTPQARLAAAEHADAVLALLSEHPLRTWSRPARALPVWVDRERALFGTWYEFFPRSEGADASTGAEVAAPSHAAERLPAVAAMGFDVVYLPPIHPIGEVNRKGPNNTLDAGPGDPGSPWAIGIGDGGHDAIHPDLGTIDDFDAFVAEADELGLEVALDLALQCAPDHPWVTEHPEWFTTRADGTIAYAENPPKKYQDIYPINFDNDPEGLYAEVLRVVAALDVRTACGSSGSTTRTPSRSRSGSG